MYEKLIKWAAKHNMQFKVSIEEHWLCGRLVHVDFADKFDGFMGSERCTYYTSDGSLLWHCWRGRLRKNERFMEMFVRLGDFADTDWVGYDDSPLFTMVPYWKYAYGTWGDVKGTFYWVDKLPEDREDMLRAGCEFLKSHAEYAPENVSDVIFVPNGVNYSLS